MSQRVKSPFVPSRTALLTMIIIAAVATAAVYVPMSSWLIHRLVRAYEESAVAELSRGESTTVAIDARNAASWNAFLTSMRDDGALPSDTSSDVLVEAGKALARNTGMPASISADVPLIDVLVHVAQAYGADADPGTGAAHKRAELRSAFASLLAGTTKEADVSEAVTKALPPDTARVRVLPTAFSATGGGWTDRGVAVQLLFRTTGAWEKCSRAGDAGSLQGRSCDAGFAVATAFANSLDSAEKVKSARMAIGFWVGAIQFLLYFAATLLVLLLVHRWLRHKVNIREWRKLRGQIIALPRDQATNLATALNHAADNAQHLPSALASEIAAYLTTLGTATTAQNAVAQAIAVVTQSSESLADTTIIRLCDTVAAETETSRWPIHWLARSLPALGFLGTVLGISLALRNADLLVKAGTAGARSVAMLQVSGTLGIAFTTTFVALVLGLITSLASDLQFAREDEFVDDLQVTFIRHVNPTL